MKAPDDFPSHILIEEGRIARRVEELAGRISAEWPAEHMIAVVALRGSFIFAADLLRRMSTAIRVEVDFIRVSSYGAGQASSGVVRLVSDLETHLEGRAVLLIEDIIDSGRTVEFIQRRILEDRPALLETVALLQKERPRAQPVSARWVGFDIPDVFVVGYGLDLAERHRNLPELRTLTNGPNGETEALRVQEWTQV